MGREWERKDSCNFQSDGQRRDIWRAVKAIARTLIFTPSELRNSWRVSAEECLDLAYILTGPFGWCVENKQWWGRGRSETSWEATAGIQVAEDDSSNQGGSSWDGEKWLDCGWIFKVELVGLPDELAVEDERKRGIKMTSRILSWATGRIKLSSTEMGKSAQRNGKPLLVNSLNSVCCSTNFVSSPCYFLPTWLRANGIWNFFYPLFTLSVQTLNQIITHR